MIRGSRRRNRRRLMAEINVVPYIDVMLVLLVIFMVTAPLITTGVKIDLPQEKSEVMAGPSSDSVVISVDISGDYYIDVGEDKNLPATDEVIFKRVQTVLRYNPKTPVFVKGDNQVDYGRVVHAMVVAQAAGAAEVGLITLPDPRER